MADVVAALLRRALILLMSLLVVTVSWQVLSRYLLAEPSSWTEEAARFLLVWIGILGAAYVAHAREHLAIDILPRKLSGKAQWWLRLFIELAIMAFAASAMILGGGRLVLITCELNQVTPALGMPTAILYSVVPLSGVLIVAFAIGHIRELITANAGEMG